MKHLTYIILFLFLLGSCTYPCGKSDGLHLNFVSFSPDETENFSISRYEKGGNFSQLIGTVSFDSARLHFKVMNDTLKLIIYDEEALLPSGFDYKIYLPSTNSTYSITNLNEPQQTGVKNGQAVYCMNMIESCKLNAVDIKISNENLYLKK